MEYCERLIQSLKQNQESFLKQLWKMALDTFINHPAWSQNLSGESSGGGLTSSTTAGSSSTHQISLFKPSYVSRMDQRVQEMKERRKRLIKILFKKEGRLSEYEAGYKTVIQRKQQVVKRYTNQ